MIDVRLEEWIQRGIDGEITPDESVRLRKALAEDPEAQDLQQRLEEVARRLDAVESVDPPADLRDEIMRSLPRERLKEDWLPDGQAGPVTGREGHVWGGLRLRDLYAFATGAVLAAVVVALVFVSGRGPRFDSATLTGTMGWGSQEAGEVVDRQRVDGEGFSALAEASTGEGWLQVVISLETDDGMDVALGFDPARLAPVGFERSAPPAGGLEMDPDRIRFDHEGASTYRILFRSVPGEGEAPPLILELHHGDATLTRTLNTRLLPD